MKDCAFEDTLQKKYDKLLSIYFVNSSTLNEVDKLF